MLKSHCIKKMVLVTMMGTLLCLGSDGLTMEQAVAQTDSQQFPLANNTERMSVFGYGHVSSLSDMPMLPDHKTQEVTEKELKKAERHLSPKAENARVDDKLRTVTRWILKYLTFEGNNEDERPQAFSVKSMIDADRPWKSEFDYTVSLEVGAGQDPKNLGLNTIRVSTQGFSTHLDAVYDCRNDALAFILSSRHINAHLMDGMRLEFQVSPTNSGGAVLMMLSF